MTSMVICVPTYRRNDELAELLTALDAQTRPPADALGMRVLVIDNNPDARARSVVDAFCGTLTVNYLHETRAGVTHVRNRALQAAADDDLLVFIDDDELPAEDWLAELWRRYEESGAAVVFGSVEALYEGPAPAWMKRGGFHAKTIASDGLRTKPGGTDNCLIDLAAVRRHGLAFDPALTLIGGEDTLFFDALLQRGEVFANAARAITYERIPPERATLGWLARRWQRTGLTDGLMIYRRRGAGPIARLRAGLDGVVRMAVGGPMAAFAWLIGGGRMSAAVARGLYTFQRGRGMVDFMRGREVREYARSPGKADVSPSY